MTHTYLFALTLDVSKRASKHSRIAVTLYPGKALGSVGVIAQLGER